MASHPRVPGSALTRIIGQFVRHDILAVLSSRRVGSVTVSTAGNQGLYEPTYSNDCKPTIANDPALPLAYSFTGLLALVRAMRYLCDMAKRKQKNPGGRPKLPDDERRSRQIVVRLTEAEYELLAHRAKCLDSQVSSVVRDVIVSSLGKP